MSNKPTNPKEAFGDAKLPLHLFPVTAIAYGTVGLLEGALKYGRSNFRADGVKASTYVSALLRHTYAYMEGQDCDPHTGVPHLANMIACVAILIEGVEAGNMTDDRNFPLNGVDSEGFKDMMERLTTYVPHLKELYADKAPQHYTIGDANEEE